MFTNNFDIITTKSIKTINFVFRAITSFIFRVIAGFIFSAIVSFVFVDINLLCDYSGKYLLQIKIKFRKLLFI